MDRFALPRRAAIAMLAAFAVWRGVVPAWSGVDTDFPNYYVASRALLDGAPIAPMYDSTWFSAKAVQYGLHPMSRFSPFPPPTVFVMLPLARLAPQNALRVWTLISIACLVIATLLLARITGRSWEWCAVLVLGAGIGVATDFRFGQFYAVLLALLILGYRGIQTGRGVWGGMALGAGIAVKYYPAVYLAPAIARRQWSLVWAAAITTAILAAACVPFWGSGEVPVAVALQHLGGSVAGQSPYATSFQTWTPMLRQLFVYDALENPTPAVDAPFLFDALRFAVIAATVGVLIWTWRRTRAGTEDLPLRAAMIGIATMWAMPLSATYHGILLALPVALLLSRGERWSVWQRIVALAYAAIGFMPYALFRGFAGRGLLAVFAFPRVWMMTAMLIAAMAIVRDHSSCSRR